MSDQPTREGLILFTPPSAPSNLNTAYNTYYKVFGDLSSSSPPLIVLHGGPGAGHEYLLPFSQLWTQHHIPVIFYDQLGCGASTHLKHLLGATSFWTMSLFVAELNNLIDHLHLRSRPGYHILGQSWGGMLAATFATTQPPGLRRLILASAAASFSSIQARSRLLRASLSPEQQDVLNEAERTDDWETPACREVTMMLNRRHLCRTDPMPREMLPALKNRAEDDTVYRTMYWTNWLAPKGGLEGWTCVEGLGDVKVPTLLYDGEWEPSHEMMGRPFFDRIEKVRWLTWSGSGHMCHLEDGPDGDLREKVVKTVGEFLLPIVV